MPTYTDYFTPDLFFVTCTTVDREPVLGTTAVMHLLRNVLKRVKQMHAFSNLGYVFLPDHLHLLIKPAAAVLLAQIIDALRSGFSADYQRLMGMPQPMVIWQQRYQVHKVQDSEDFAARLDYIHYDPVQHNLTQKPEGWPHSSYQTWLERGVYTTGWGWNEPERVQGKRWG